MNLHDTSLVAINSIESQDVRDYLIKIGHEFSINEQITLFYKSDKTLQDKIDFIKTLSNINSECKLIADEALNTIYKLQEVVSADNIALQFSYTEDKFNKETVCVKNIATVKSYIEKYNVKLSNGIISVIDLNCGERIGDIYINDAFEIVEINIYDIDSSVFFSYVDIPNDFKSGDVVKVHNWQVPYVIIGDSQIPEHLKKDCDWFDSTLEVVPESQFSGTRDTYKEQIDNIISERIHDIETDTVLSDKILSHHEHIPIIWIQHINI